MLRAADAVPLNETDLLPYPDFDTTAFLRDLARVRPDPTVLPVSARTGDGLPAWYTWLRELTTVG